MEAPTEARIRSDCQPGPTASRARWQARMRRIERARGPSKKAGGKRQKPGRQARKPRRRRRTAVPDLPAIHERAAGVDLGSREHWACCPPGQTGAAKVRAFGTTTPALEELADWLAAEGAETVAMEATHVYWIPLHELLEQRGLEVALANARTLYNLPGRHKSDFQDCQWLQLLHSRGLLRGSFRPREEIAKLRALQRQLGNLVEERSRSVQWMQKALDQMNVQVHRAVSDLTGKTGMAIVRAIAGGERDARKLAALRDRRCRRSAEEFVRYLTGNWR